MKMIQTMYPCEQPWTEIFYDGEAQVVNNIINVKYEHWRDVLLMRGFVDLPEEKASAEPQVEEPSPTKRTRSRKRVSNGESNE